jgi:thymidylate synthase (FAD)
MRLVKPYYEVENFPPGDEVLAMLERAARTCYKSEHKIEDGRETCSHCQGTGYEAKLKYSEMEDRVSGAHVQKCSECGGVGYHQVDEPSSYAIIKKILKSNRRAKLIKKVAERLETVLVDTAGVTMEDVASALIDDVWNDDPAHESVIEHVSATVRFICNRGITHEMVRHRIAAYSQESTRYCNYSKGKFGESITFIDDDHYLTDEQREWGRYAQKVMEETYMKMVESGLAPQIARNYLPIGLKTEIVATYNMRQWRHFFRMRCSPRAHPQMRELVVPLLLDFRERVPILFDDVYPNMTWPEAT